MIFFLQAKVYVGQKFSSQGKFLPTGAVPCFALKEATGLMSGLYVFKFGNIPTSQDFTFLNLVMS